MNFEAQRQPSDDEDEVSMNGSNPSGEISQEPEDKGKDDAEWQARLDDMPHMGV